MNPPPFSSDCVAFAHHWLMFTRGGERVLQQLIAPFPKAPIYTLVAHPPSLPESLLHHPIRTTLLQNLPHPLRKKYPYFLPLYPRLFQSLPLPAHTRLLVSSDASLCKIIGTGNLPHVCYCHTPARYLWDHASTHPENQHLTDLIHATALQCVTPALRNADRIAARNVTHFLANSRFVQNRIRQHYQRPSTVLYPGVNTDAILPSDSHDGYFLIVSHLVPYKRIDLAVEAFNSNGLPLKIIGQGPQDRSLKKQAAKNIEFLGPLNDQTTLQYYRRCRAFLFPGLEDFGLTPVEAQAAGKPVIAFGQGGALESVIHGQTGIFFPEPSAQSLNEAVQDFIRREATFHSTPCRTNAEHFSLAVFQKNWRLFLQTHFKDIPLAQNQKPENRNQKTET